MRQRLFPTRRFLSCGGLVLVVALTQPAPANAQHPKRHDEYKHQVEKLEDVWRAAQLSGDVLAISQLLSDDYVGITMSGQVVTKEQQLDRMRKRTMVLSKYEVSDRKVKLNGTTAIVMSLASIEGTNEGQPIHGTFRSMRVYTRLPGGGWKVTNFEATRVGPPPLRGDRQDHPDDSQRP